jgi:DNA polymerase III subunit beta
MKLTCKQQDLSEALSKVKHAVSSRPSMPILSNMLLIADHGYLKLVATNIEISIVYRIHADIEQEGTTALPARLFSDFIESLPIAPLEIDVDENTHRTRVTGLRSTAIIHGTEPSEFPLLPSLEGEATPLELETKLLKQIIAEVTIAASNDHTRAAFTGVNMVVGKGKLTFAAADSFRLAVRGISLPDYQETRDAIIVPASILKELARVLPEEGMVHVVVPMNKAQVLFHTERMDMTSRLISGVFPEFRCMIPPAYITRAVVETKELMAMVKSVIPFTPDSASHMAYVTVKPGENNGLEPGTLTLRATTEGVGENVSTIYAAVDGPEQQIIFNAEYLSEYLTVLKTPTVALELISSAHPGVFKPVGIVDYTYVVMPMSPPR